MKQSDVKKIIDSNISKSISEHGFKKSSVKGFLLTYVRTTINCTERIRIASQHSFGGTQLYITFGCRFDEVEKVMMDLNNKTRLLRRVLDDDETIVFSPSADPDGTGGIPEFWSEETCNLSSLKLLGIVKKEIYKFEELDTITKVDSIINSENSWETDDGKQFAIYGDFFVKRLVIARLALNPRFDNIAERNYQIFEGLLKNEGTFNTVFPRREDHPIGFTVKYLREL